MNNSTISYTGIVDINFERNGKIFKSVQNHNNGLDGLFMTLCKAMAGYSIDNDRPLYMDLRKGPFSTSAGESLLTRRVSISGSSYSFDESLGKWVCKFFATISYNDLTSSFKNISAISEEIRLYMTDGKKIPTDIAFLTLKENGSTTTDLSNLISGTQALVQWNMCFENSAI